MIPMRAAAHGRTPEFQWFPQGGRMNARWWLAACIVALMALPAHGESRREARARMADDAAVCLDRCDAGFAGCLGSQRPPPQPTPLPPRGDETVPTPPPFEQCLLARDVCVAQCQLTLAEERARMAKRRDGAP